MRRQTHTHTSEQSQITIIKGIAIQEGRLCTLLGPGGLLMARARLYFPTGVGGRWRLGW